MKTVIMYCDIDGTYVDQLAGGINLLPNSHNANDFSERAQEVINFIDALSEYVDYEQADNMIFSFVSSCNLEEMEACMREFMYIKEQIGLSDKIILGKCFADQEKLWFKKGKREIGFSIYDDAFMVERSASQVKVAQIMRNLSRICNGQDEVVNGVLQNPELEIKKVIFADDCALYHTILAELLKKSSFDNFINIVPARTRGIKATTEGIWQLMQGTKGELPLSAAIQNRIDK